ncbi:hypothetical protein CYMTET_25729 [Cymbomonas tetramitiformis]|uniref:Uncharacterized protein n=1 Tax=Cymbomonas tetramitiformis TaxID=36881 RepID=A0AAE0FTH8_9CHLO|nr:hypothetical protein CYMTET_25729 [Cymbomonas tetramitiformis]
MRSGWLNRAAPDAGGGAGSHPVGLDEAAEQDGVESAGITWEGVAGQFLEAGWGAIPLFEPEAGGVDRDGPARGAGACRVVLLSRRGGLPNRRSKEVGSIIFDARVADQCVEVAVEPGAILPKLARLNDPQVQLLSIRFCVYPRFMHLVGGVPLHLLMRGPLEHDTGTHQCLQEVVDSLYLLGEEVVALSQLPTTKWGWG